MNAHTKATMPQAGYTRPKIYEMLAATERKSHWVWQNRLAKYRPDQYQKPEDVMNMRSKRLALEHQVWAMKLRIAALKK